MTTARSVRFFVNLGLGLVFMVCQLNAVLCHYSSVARFQVTVLGSSMQARFGSVRLGANVPLTIKLAAGPQGIFRASRLRGQRAGNVCAKLQSRSCKAAACRGKW